MKSLFDPATAQGVKERIAGLGPDTSPLWGRMSAAQVLAHCSAALHMATGDIRPPRKLVGRLLGWNMKSKELGADTPMRPNSQTVKELVIDEECDVETEQTWLVGLINRFVSSGPRGCTSHPHPFFGRMTPQEWSVYMYKHLDHHLRQLGV